jgi:hypothetical protein
MNNLLLKKFLSTRSSPDAKKGASRGKQEPFSYQQQLNLAPRRDVWRT